MRCLTSDYCDKCQSGWIETESRTYKRCECVTESRLQRLWKHYGLDPKNVKKVNSYNPMDDITDQAKRNVLNYIMRFKDLKKENNNWLAFMGQSGSGKSHLAIAAGATLLNRGHEVIYMPYSETMKEIKGAAFDYNAYSKLLDKYLKTEVLVIDDLFKDKTRNGMLIGELTEVDIKHIYPILNYRYNNSLPTIISTECMPEMLRTLDKALAGRILERCGGNFTVFRGDKYDYRARGLTK